jgi:hypothetical protein
MKEKLKKDLAHINFIYKYKHQIKRILIIVIAFFAFIIFKFSNHNSLDLTDSKVFTRNVESDGREFLTIKKNNIVHLYKQNGQVFDEVEYQLTGSSATNIIGPIYWVRSKFTDEPSGFKIYLKAISIWETQLEVIGVNTNYEASPYHKIGDTFNVVIVVYDDKINFQGIEYKLVE